MSADAKVVDTVEQAELLPAGQWVEDANGEHWCLFQTHVMVHQWMWKAAHAHRYVSLDSIPYPLALASLTEKRDGYSCPHKRTQECGQCIRCGAVVGDTEAWRSHSVHAFPIFPIPKDGE